MTSNLPRFTLEPGQTLRRDGVEIPVTPPEPLPTDPWLRAKVERSWASVDEKMERVERHCRELVAQ